MSQKRTSTESSNDEQTNEDSDAKFQQENNAKRGKFFPFRDTTLQDIPTEILQCILVKAVAMEVKNMKLAKSVWKEKADLVMNILRTVCAICSNILTTNFFRTDLHKALDGIAQETIRMEILQRLQVDGYILTIAALKEDIFLFCLLHDHLTMTPGTCSSYKIRVYDRNNMAEVKDVIELPGIRKGRMAACNVSNCLYVLDINEELHRSSILRITRNQEQKFNIHAWISDLKFPISYTSCYSSGSLSVSDKGNLIVISRPEKPGSHVVWVYNASGVLQHEIMLSPDIYGFTGVENSVIEKSNGNLVIPFVIEQQMVLTEIDTNGTIQRQFKSSLHRLCSVDFADTSGRILINDHENRIHLLDSELNLLEFRPPRSQSNEDDFEMYQCLHFNNERNEVMSGCTVGVDVSVLNVFRFREE